jgi:hypothetical protein
LLLSFFFFFYKEKFILAVSTTNDVQMDDGNRSLNEEVSMESEQQSSMLSRSQIDDDIVEIERMMGLAESIRRKVVRI